MATYIHDNVSTYHDQDLTILVKMVHHHLSRDTNNYFLPVMMSGQTSHNPASCRWALNRQAVVVSVDGSLMRRRFHPYPYRQYTGSPYTPATASPSVLISPSGRDCDPPNPAGPRQSSDRLLCEEYGRCRVPRLTTPDSLIVTLPALVLVVMRAGGFSGNFLMLAAVTPVLLMVVVRLVVEAVVVQTCLDTAGTGRDRQVFD
nr:hypothetical protein BaRGS_026358 [Batillaria attramentaria]